MEASDRLRVVEREMQAFNNRDWDTYFSCFADSAVTYEPDEPAPILGKSGLRQRVEAYLQGFPDVRLEKQRLFGGDEWVCLNSLFRGTHNGPLRLFDGRTIPPSGRSVAVHGCSIFRVADGCIQEFIGYYDQLELLTQLGVQFRVALP